MKITIDIPEWKYQKLKESTKEYDLTIPEYVEHLIDEDREAMYELNHDTGTVSFHNLKDAINTMYLIDEYYWLEQPDDTYGTGFFTHSSGEFGRIWERVASGEHYMNGTYGLVRASDI